MIDGKYKCEMVQNFHGGINRKYGMLTINESDGHIFGTMFPPMFWLNGNYSFGSVKDNTFSFTAYFGSPCQSFSMDVTGSVEGNMLKGFVKSPMGDYELSGVKVEGKE